MEDKILLLVNKIIQESLKLSVPLYIQMLRRTLAVIENSAPGLLSIQVSIRMKCAGLHFAFGDLELALAEYQLIRRLLHNHKASVTLLPYISLCLGLI